MPFNKPVLLMAESECLHPLRLGFLMSGGEYSLVTTKEDMKSLLRESEDDGTKKDADETEAGQSSQ